MPPTTNDSYHNRDSVTFPAEIGEIGNAVDFVNGFLADNECPKNIQQQIDVAIDEILSNIARYAYETPPGSVSIQCCLEGIDAKTVVIIFSDSGEPFNPLKSEAPDITLTPEEREIGGLGILVVKKSMDEINYEYKNGMNVLTIKKNYQ
jgi:anti-sigma regulatory factor (Ser/Thr protein kinase)